MCQARYPPNFGLLPSKNVCEIRIFVTYHSLLKKIDFSLCNLLFVQFSGFRSYFRQLLHICLLSPFKNSQGKRIHYLSRITANHRFLATSLVLGDPSSCLSGQPVDRAFRLIRSAWTALLRTHDSGTDSDPGSIGESGRSLF